HRVTLANQKKIVQDLSMGTEENFSQENFVPRSLTRELCEDYLDREVFPLRPPRLGPGLNENHPGSVGIEVEMLPLISHGNKSVPSPAPLYGPEGTVSAAVERFCRGRDYKKTYQPFLNPTPQDPPEGFLYAAVV